MADEIAFFRERSEYHETMADKATQPSIRAVHRELAENYRRLADMATEYLNASD